MNPYPTATLMVGGLLSFALIGCGATRAAARWDRPSPDGPVLIGVVKGPDGRAMEDVKVTIYGGAATRWAVGETRTDGQGRYRFDNVSGSLIRNRDSEPWDYETGVCVGSIVSGNPPEHLPWKDIRIAIRPGVVERLDFTFDPSSVPEELRGP